MKNPAQVRGNLKSTHVPTRFLPGKGVCVQMQKIVCLLFCILAGAMLAAAGCTSSNGTGTASGVTPTATTGSGQTTSLLAPYALTASDVPAGFNLTGGREKGSNEVSKTAIQLGWQAGYVIVYSMPGDSTANRTTITQTITLYNTTYLAALPEVIRTSEQETTGYDYANVSVQLAGNSVTGYEAIVNQTAISASITPTPTSGVVVVKETPQDFREVAFVKGDYLDVIRVSGPAGTNEMLASLAQAAYAKLP